MKTTSRIMTAQDIYNDITSHIKKSSYRASEWYAGITKNVEQRLFNDHNVSKENGWWIHRSANTSNDARMVEEALLKWGCDGGVGGGDDAIYIYAYLKTANTRR
ncbi:MAG: hypothetical protein COA74_16045 [Gammaproteobacteria bacterium]|nr:MAG: hypothetical protein COA74_16045 [Gammaproteobacteria bacterium]